MRLLFAFALVWLTLCSQAQDTAGTRISPKTEIEAGFPGGQPAWTTFLNKNLHYPDEAIGDGIQGDIVVRFQVDEQGVVSDIQVLSGPTRGGLREEAIRIIKISGKWEPKIQNGVKVKSFKKEPISFRLVK